MQQPGTFRTDRERLDAALPHAACQAADAYPDSEAGITARFRARRRARRARTLRGSGTALSGSGHRRRGRRSIYRYTARLGLGEAQLAQEKNDAAIATFKDLSTDTNSQLPVDGVLMQLGRAAQAAGKKDEATRAFTRVVDEFPQSLYASEAKEKSRR